MPISTDYTPTTGINTTMPCAIGNTSVNAKPVQDSTLDANAVMLVTVRNAQSMSAFVIRASLEDNVKYHVSSLPPDDMMLDHNKYGLL